MALARLCFAWELRACLSSALELRTLLSSAVESPACLSSDVRSPASPAPKLSDTHMAGQMPELRRKTEGLPGSRFRLKYRSDSWGNDGYDTV